MADAAASPGGGGPPADSSSDSDSDLEFDVENLIQPIAPVLPDDEIEQKKARKAATFAKAASEADTKRGFRKADGTPKHQGVGRFVFKDKLAAAAKKAGRPGRR